MFRHRITALHQLEQQMQFLTLEHSNLEWRILQCGYLTEKQIKSTARRVFHFLPFRRTEHALSLRQDSVLYKSISIPDDSGEWWIRQQVDEVLTLEHLSCDYRKNASNLELFICENKMLDSMRSLSFPHIDIMGWQVTDLICLCLEYNQRLKQKVEGYIDVQEEEILLVKFSAGIHLHYLDKNAPNLLSDINQFFTDMAVKRVLLLGDWNGGDSFSFSVIDLSSLWQALNLDIESCFYPTLACALGAIYWQRLEHD